MADRATLTVTAKGQITLKRDILAHLRVNPGDKVTVELAATDGVVMRAAPRGDIGQFFGCLPDKGRSVSIDEMNEAIEAGWAGL